MYRSDQELFGHVIEEIEFLQDQTASQSEESFLRYGTMKRAFARSLEIIGEAVKNISNETIVENPHIKWRNIAGMRDKLIHGYFSVNYKLVWDVAVNVIPRFKQDILEIQKRAQGSQ